MVSTFPKLLLAALLGLGSFGAAAGTGVLSLPGAQDDGQVTVFYPTDAPDRTTQRGPFTLSLAQDAPPARGNGRLVMISHGSGGGPWVNADLARSLVAAGFVVAVPTHHRDNALDPSRPGPDSWKRRPGEVSRAIDVVTKSRTFAPLLASDRVGLYGMSAGGHTALSFAGGRWSPASFARHCDEAIAEDFAACVGLFGQLRGDAFDGVKKMLASLALRALFRDDTWQQHRDARVRAIVAAVPLAADFDPASLAVPRVPLALVTAGQDKWLPLEYHARPVLKACLPRCEQLVHLPTGGHGALLSPPPPLHLLGPIAANLLGDPPGFDRALVAQANERIADYFRKHLLP